MKWKATVVALMGTGTLLGLAALLSSNRAGADSKVAALRPATIDHLIRAEWAKEQIVPAPPVDDGRFLRRVYLDITGTIPPSEAVSAFLADKSPEKRTRVVEELLNNPRYADQWTNYWDEVLMGRTLRTTRQVDRVAFRQWLHLQFEQNVPWDKFVTSLITAAGVNSQGGSYAKAIGLNIATKAMDTKTTDTKATDQNTTETASDVPINGATNWILKYQNRPEDLSGTASKIFLGVQIQCAQCHDHKTEKWKQEDFRRFTANFMNTRPRPLDAAKAKAGLLRVELIDVNRPFVLRGKNAGNSANYAQAQPAALDGTSFADSPNRRQALAAWMTSYDNPWFAPAIVNRMWAHFMGRGFVEPIDDFRPSNTTVLPDLLKQLSEDFKAHNYDLKHLIRTICATQVYQLSAQPARTDQGNTLWARYRLKTMTPEQLMDALITATNAQAALEQRWGDRLEVVKLAAQRQLSFLFDVDEEFEQKEFDGTIPQALLLLNGIDTNRAATPIPGTTLATVLSMLGSDASKIEALYLRTLSRKPTAAEIARWTQFVNTPRDMVVSAPASGASGKSYRPKMGQIPNIGKRMVGGGPGLFAGMPAPSLSTPKEQAYEDLFWALLNSSEFLFNH